MGIDSLFPDFVKVPIMAVVAALLVLPQAARRYPRIEWLQPFKLRDNRTEAQKQKARQTQNFLTGLELIGFGLCIPPGYALLEVMFMSSMGTMEMFLVGGASLLCVGLGIFVMVRRRTL